MIISILSYDSMATACPPRRTSPPRCTRRSWRASPSTRPPTSPRARTRTRYVTYYSAPPPCAAQLPLSPARHIPLLPIDSHPSSCSCSCPCSSAGHMTTHIYIYLSISHYHPDRGTSDRVYRKQDGVRAARFRREAVGQLRPGSPDAQDQPALPVLFGAQAHVHSPRGRGQRPPPLHQGAHTRTCPPHHCLPNHTAVSADPLLLE